MKPDAATDGAIVFFDGVCNLCERSVQFIIRHDPKGYFRFAALQSAMGQEARATIVRQHAARPDSVVLLEEGKYYTGSDAALRIARHLSGGWKWLVVFRILPRFFREPFYRLIARNRYRLFGKKQSCWLPSPELRARFVDGL